MSLSIGRAWDEARGVMARDGSALFAIAAAMMVLPNAIIETIAPSPLRTPDSPWWLSALGFAVAVLSLAAQLSVSRVALGPTTTVGGAIGLGFRRLPALAGALALMALPLLLILVAVVAASGGGEFDPRKLPPGVTLAVLPFMLAVLYLFVRLLFLTPLAADRPLGSVALLRQAWRLSSGRSGKLFLLVLVLLLFVGIIAGGVAGAINAVVILAVGPVEPGNVSAVLVALIQAALGAIVSVSFVLVVCRLYVQAAGGEAAPASVPHAGGD